MSLPAADLPSTAAGGPLRYRRVAPHEVRDAAVAFFWRMRAWPYPDLESYYRFWDWRYSALSDDTPAVWIATEGDVIVGHIAVYFRRCRIDGQIVRIGVPGNFLVDTSHRDTMIGARLASSPRMLVRSGEIDMLLAYGNRIAHAMFIRLGARDLGYMKSFVDIRRWAPVLSRRIPGGAILAPIAATASRIRKVLLGSRMRDLAGFDLRQLDAAGLRGIDRSHWRPRTGYLVQQTSAEYLVNRFLNCPVREHSIFGVYERASGLLQGLVATEGSTRLKIWACEVNPAVLDEVEAVQFTAMALPDAQSVLVPLLPRCQVARQFAAAGFLRERFMDHVEANTSWSAYWRESHPLAARFAEVSTWNLWYSWSHH